jgi:hypothetical protein
MNTNSIFTSISLMPVLLVIIGCNPGVNKSTTLNAVDLSLTTNRALASNKFQIQIYESDKKSTEKKLLCDSTKNTMGEGFSGSTNGVSLTCSILYRLDYVKFKINHVVGRPFGCQPNLKINGFSYYNMNCSKIPEDLLKDQHWSRASDGSYEFLAVLSLGGKPIQDYSTINSIYSDENRRNYYLTLNYNSQGSSQKTSPLVCQDEHGKTIGIDANLDKTSCRDGNQKRLIIIKPNTFGETWLPGCAGKPSENPDKCRFLNAFEDESYAVRLKFKEGLNPDIYKDMAYAVNYDTQDSMYAYPEYRSFQMTISDLPGDFTGNFIGSGIVNNKLNCVRLNGSSRGSIYVQDERQNNSKHPSACRLKAGKDYYINIRPTNFGCKKTGDSTNVFCSALLYDTIPGSGQPAKNVPILPENKIRLITIDPSPTGENWLPGCAGKPNADPNSCRLQGSITDETYAIRFQFNGLEPKIYKGTYAPINVDSRDAMDNADIENRYFRVAISKLKGDFSGGFKNCTTPENQAQSSLNVMDERQVNLLQGRAKTYAQANYCILKSGQLYYINVKPKNPGCKTDTGKGPNPASCRVRIFNQIPGSKN